MEKVIKTKTVVEEEVYVAEDGTEFNDEYDCETYEMYYKRDILDLVEGYIIFDEEAKERIAENRTPVGCYAICLKQLPERRIYYIQMYIKAHYGATDLIPFCGKYEENVLYYCDYSEAMNGRYGWNGWVSLGDKSDIEAEIKRKEKHLAILDSLLKKD